MFNTWTRVLVLCLFAISVLTSSTRSTRSARPTRPCAQAKRNTAAFWRASRRGISKPTYWGNLTFFNGPLCRILGYGADELRGLNTQAFTTPETSVAVEGILHQVQQTGEATSVFRLRHSSKGRQPKDLELSISSCRTAPGGRRVPRGPCAIVTERKRAEEERKRLEIQLQAAQKMEAIGTLGGAASAHDFQ